MEEAPITTGRQGITTLGSGAKVRNMAGEYIPGRTVGNQKENISEILFKLRKI